MATMRLVPSSYEISNTSITVTDAANAYNNTDNTTYARFGTTSTSSRYVYYRGFNFGSLPTGAVVSSFTIKYKAYESTMSTSSSYRPRIVNGTTTLTGSSTAITTSTVTNSFTGVTDSWDTISGYGSDFGIRFTVRRSGNSGTGYLYLYGCEIEVTYTVPNPRTVTTTLTGSGTIDPSGTETYYDGDTYNLTVTPTDTSSQVTATQNGSSITLTAHTSAESISATADSFTTGFSGGSNMAFYTSSSATGNNFNYAVGHTAESPGSTSSGSGSWTYVKDNGSSTNYTGYADFVFDFSSIPAGSTINSVEVKCYGATESTTESTAHSEIVLYSGTTQKSTSQKFTSTTNSIITISSPGTWTRDELQSAKLRFTVGYYGGHIFGITWTVSFTPPLYYYYSTTVSGDMTVAVVIGTPGPSASAIYFKNNGSWVQATTVYKKVNGSWVQQSELSNVFQSGVNYVKGN